MKDRFRRWARTAKRSAVGLSQSPPACANPASVSATITWFLVVALGQALLLLPGGLASLFLDADASNLPLLWAFLLPAGPALAAGLATLRAREADDDRGPLAKHGKQFGD